MNKVVNGLCCACSLVLLPMLTACHEIQENTHYHGYYGSPTHVEVENYGVRHHHTARQVPPPPPPRSSARVERGTVHHGHAPAREKVVVNPDPAQAHVEIEKNQHGHED